MAHVSVIKRTKERCLAYDLKDAMIAGRRLLVTGGTGLVGSAIQQILMEQDWYSEHAHKIKFLSSKDGDLR